MGFMIASIYGLGLGKDSAVSILATFFMLFLVFESLRLRIPAINDVVLRAWGPLMRQSEIHRFSGTLYYLGASVLVIGLFPREIAVLSLLYLAFGDPVASLFGILYGDRSIRFSNGKSLIGSLASIAVCVVITSVFTVTLPISWISWLFLVSVGGLAGGLSEHIPFEIDDNFTIPVVSGMILWTVFILLAV